MKTRLFTISRIIAGALLFTTPAIAQQTPKTTTPTAPVKKKYEIGSASKFHSGGGFGLGASGGSSNGKKEFSQNAQGTFYAFGTTNDDDGQPLVASFGKIKYNVFAGSSSSGIGTSIAGNADGLIGHNFNKSKPGLDIYVGASANFGGEIGWNMAQKNSVDGRFGLETGLLANINDKVILMASPSVAAGGQNVIVPVGSQTGQNEYLFRNDWLSFGGVGRVMVGDRAFASIMYFMNPDMNSGDGKKVSASRIKGQVYYKVNDKWTATMSCASVNYDQQLKDVKVMGVDSKGNQVVDHYDWSAPRNFKAKNLEVGLIRTF